MLSTAKKPGFAQVTGLPWCDSGRISAALYSFSRMGQYRHCFALCSWKGKDKLVFSTCLLKEMYHTSGCDKNKWARLVTVV